ncbi:V-set and immunoglobulin domain-containing protein 1 isoform X1 [Microcaecilia unicolor]|uniref:V-set and immunoglobulin domain-containing protein 1 isoform X1 n=1 Tax=Microcaecilia unicolor TaxID=1415580 RepID=UPI00118597E7|nr:V-set and immunoglobulin domain-containing protein 1 isoform X1 [Microcaecilia unicolor]
MRTAVLKIFAIIASLSGLSVAVQVTVPQVNVNASIGQDITLLCTYVSSSPLTNLSISWFFYARSSHQYFPFFPCFSAQSWNESSLNQCLKMEFTRDARGRCSWRSQVYYSSRGYTEAIGNFKNRVTASPIQGNASITISNVKSEDSGLYACEVTNPPDFEGNNIGKVQLIVTVPPSTPHCSIRGAVQTGHYITLECYSKDGMPPPTYQWNKVVNNELKPTPPEMNSKKGELIIGNLSSFETGHYRCTASNRLGNATCELDLSTGAGEGIIAAAVIGAILVAAVICAIVVFLTIKLKKSKKEKFAVAEMKPMNQTQQQSSSKHGTAEQTEPTAESLLAAQPGHGHEAQQDDSATSAVIENGEREGQETPAMA